MKAIYCAGAIRGDTSFRRNYELIIKLVAEAGFEALTELNLQDKVVLSDKDIFLRDKSWLDKSEMMIAELSGISTGVGFEISYALYVRKIPVLVVYSSSIDSISAMISGCNSEFLSVKNYSSDEELTQIVNNFITGSRSS